jgi:DNA-binding Xre family transcriptional regulator
MNSFVEKRQKTRFVKLKIAALAMTVSVLNAIFHFFECKMSEILSFRKKTR